MESVRGSAPKMPMRSDKPRRSSFVGVGNFARSASCLKSSECTDGVELLVVMHHVLIGMIERPLEPFGLQGGDFTVAHRLYRVQPG
ncbi:MAG: hypothetical protein ACI8W7_002758 [Gammaproteobacteria bacterium]|jgi:hypothetical protein